MNAEDRYVETPDGRVRIPGDLAEASHCDGGVLVSWRNSDVELTFTQQVQSPLQRRPNAVGVSRIFLSPEELQHLAAKLTHAAQVVRDTPHIPPT